MLGLTIITQGLFNVADQCGVTHYAANRDVVKQYTGAHLTQPQFRTYCEGLKSQYLISSRFGTDTDIESFYKSYGQKPPEGELLNAEIFHEILNSLGAKGVILDLGPPGSTFRERFTDFFVRLMEANSKAAPNFHPAYLQDLEVKRDLINATAHSPEFSALVKDRFFIIDGGRRAESPSAASVQSVPVLAS